VLEEQIQDIRPVRDYVFQPKLLPTADTARWFVLSQIRTLVQRQMLEKELSPLPEGTSLSVLVNCFLMALPAEHRLALLIDLTDIWGQMGADESMLATLREVTGLDR
jgi:hypothetical protein